LNNFRKVALSSFFLAGTMLLTSCGLGGTTSAAGPATSAASIDAIALPAGVEIDFWHIQATIYGEAITEMVADFNATNEWGIVVNESFKGSYQELNQAVRAALAGGGAPDVSMAYENDVLEYVANDVIVPLDPYLDSEKYGVSEEKMADLVPGVLDRQRVEAYNGSTLSWPHGNSSLGMYYNEDLFAAAGLTAAPADWDEFLQQARAVKQEAGVAYVAMSPAKNGVYYNMLRSKGVTPFDPAAGTTEFNSTESIESLELLTQLFDEELVYTASDTEQEFTNERAAAELGTTARTSSKIEQIGDRFNWSVALTPQESAAPITQLFGGNHVILASDESEQELAAWLFMRWFADTDAQATYAARTGYSPAVQSSLATDLLSANYAQNPQKAEAFENVFIHAQILSPTAAGNAIDDMVTGIVEEVVLGWTTPQEAGERMNAEAIRLLESAPQN
jgi:ABC-type glycerol-3-phosphate transport system substrate-binding protein